MSDGKGASAGSGLPPVPSGTLTLKTYGFEETRLIRRIERVLEANDGSVHGPGRCGHLAALIFDELRQPSVDRRAATVENAELKIENERLRSERDEYRRSRRATAAEREDQVARALAAEAENKRLMGEARAEQSSGRPRTLYLTPFEGKALWRLLMRAETESSSEQRAIERIAEKLLDA